MSLIGEMDGQAACLRIKAAVDEAYADVRGINPRAHPGGPVA